MKLSALGVMLLVPLGIGVGQAVGQTIDQPPIYNDRVGSTPSCSYSGNVGVCGTECRCSPTVGGSTGWKCDGCPVSGRWPLFSELFYAHAPAACANVNFIDLPLLDLPSGLEKGNVSLAPNNNITLTPVWGTSPVGRLDRIREVPLECTPRRVPVVAAARYRLMLSAAGSGADCDGAVFFVTAEYNASLFEVTLHGRIRTGTSYACSSATLSPFAPRLIVGGEVSTGNDLRYPDLQAVTSSGPAYVKVRIKPGRSSRDAGSQTVKLRVHSFNWGGDHGFPCDGTGSCDEGYRFQQRGAATVQVFNLELPPDWCEDAAPLEPEDALPISSLSEGQRSAAEFEGLGTKTVNDLTAELPSLRVGHCRFRAGRTLPESLGNDAYWHNSFACNEFVRFDAFGIWTAVDDLPGWMFQQVGSELVVTDPCEGVTYHFQRPGGGALGEQALKLAAVKRGGATLRTYNYAGGGVSGNLISQVDTNGNRIDYTYTTQGSDMLLTVTGTEAGAGTRVLTALYSSAATGSYMKSATWSNGGPSRQYEFMVSPANPAIDGRIDRVLDAAGGVLLDFEYDSQGRLIETKRGTGPTLQTVNKHTYINTAGGGQMLGDTFLVNQCFVDATQYQATVRTLDKFNRAKEVKEFQNLQTLPVAPTAVPSFTGPSFVTTTKYRGPGESTTTIGNIAGSHFTIEKVLPGSQTAEYSVFDNNFNVIRTFMDVPSLTNYSASSARVEKRSVHQQFAGSWQTTQQIDVPRNQATTMMGYDAASGFLTSRTMPSISAANSGSGLMIPGRTETFIYDPVNKKRVVSETRNDGQNNTIAITNGYDAYDRLMTRTETGPCGTRVTQSEHNAFGQLIQQIDVDGYVTAKVYNDPAHPNSGSGLLLGQHTFASGDTGSVLQQARHFYYTSGPNRGRLERIEIADHNGSFNPGSPSGWQKTTFTYDVYGRVTTKTLSHTVKPGVTIWTYAYDRQDRVRQITYPDGMWVRSTRDGRGLLVREEIGSGGDAANGTGGTIVLTNTYAYNPNAQLIDRLNQSAADVPEHSTYEYDIFNRRSRQTDLEDGSVGYSIVTNYEYNTGRDATRRYVRENLAGLIRDDVRMSVDELGRGWRETTLEDPSAGLNPSCDRIITTTFDVRGNEVRTRVTDTARGDAVTSRLFTCFDHLDSASQVLNDSETAVTDVQTDGRGNTTVIVDPVGNRTEHDYDALSQRVESRYFERVGAIDVLQLRTEMVHTSREQRARMTQFNASGTPLDRQRWEYDVSGFLSRWSRMAIPSADNPHPAFDRVVDMASDGLGRTKSRTVYADGTPRTTEWSYDAIGRPWTITHPVAGNTETLTYASQSAQLQSRAISDEIGARTVTTAFDPFGRLRSETFVAIPPVPAVTTTYAYDAVGRRTRVTDPQGYVTLSVYDGLGQVTSVAEDFGGADERVVSFTYTQKGDLLTQTANDGEGPQTSTFTHDRAGRRTRVQHPDASAIDYTYDLAGRLLTRETEDGFVTYYKHNWRGQFVEKRQGSSGGPILESFSYDALGRRTAAAVGDLAASTIRTVQVYGDGTEVSGDKLIDPAFADSPALVTQHLDGVSKSSVQRFNTTGQRSQIAYPAGTDIVLSYGHDGFGQVSAINRNGQRLANFTYAGRNVTSRQVRTTAADTETWIELAWTRRDQLRRIRVITNRIRTGSTGGVGGTTEDLASFANIHNPASNLASQTVSRHPVVGENGTHTHLYDRLHRLFSTNAPNTTNDESWQLDKLGNWETHADRFGGSAEYADNILNQYTSITGQSIAPAYDAKGNLVRNERGYGFTYDFENRLTRVFDDNAPANGVYDFGETMHAEYVVDALGRRVKATIDGAVTYRFYDPDDLGLVLAEFDAGDPGTASKTFVNGPTYLDEKLLARSRSGREYYYLQKDLYTVVGVVNDRGCSMGAIAYDAYGQPVTITGPVGDTDDNGSVDLLDFGRMQVCFRGSGAPPPAGCGGPDLDDDNDVDRNDYAALAPCIADPLSPNETAAFVNPFAFTGQRLDALDPINPALPATPAHVRLILYDSKARVFDPRHGRFHQRDPAEFLDGYNLYEYASTRPTVLTDPTGEFSLPEISLSSLASRGLQAFNAASAARDVLAKARALAAGASFQSILLAFVVEQAIDKVGGDAFERALALVNSVRKATQKAVFSNTAGRLAETAAGIQGPKAIMEFGDHFRIPDQLGKTFLLDVKFRTEGKLYLSGQLEDFIKFAKQQAPGFQVRIVVPKGTTAGGKLAEYVQDGLVVLEDTLP